MGMLNDDPAYLAQFKDEARHQGLPKRIQEALTKTQEKFNWRFNEAEPLVAPGYGKPKLAWRIPGTDIDGNALIFQSAGHGAAKLEMFGRSRTTSIDRIYDTWNYYCAGGWHCARRA